MPAGRQTFTLLPDFYMTRNKRYHILLDVDREHVMAAIELVDVFEHVLDNDRKTVIIESENQNYTVTIRRLPGPPGEPPQAHATLARHEVLVDGLLPRGIGYGRLSPKET